MDKHYRIWGRDVNCLGKEEEEEERKKEGTKNEVLLEGCIGEREREREREKGCFSIVESYGICCGVVWCIGCVLKML